METNYIQSRIPGGGGVQGAMEITVESSEMRFNRDLIEHLIERMAILEYLDPSVNGRQIVEYDDLFKYYYYETCLRQLHYMKKIKFYIDVSLCACAENKKVMSDYARNKE